MKTTRKSIRTEFFKITLVVLLLINGLYATGQDFKNLNQGALDSIKNEWWYPLLQKHDIKIKDSYHFSEIYIIGDLKKVNDSIEHYQNAFVLASGGIYFSIYEKCDSVFYNTHSKVLKVLNGSETLYKKDFSLIDPYREYDFVRFEDDFLHHTSLISTGISTSKIMKEINVLFDNYVNDLERLEIDSLEQTISDNDQAGFILGGKYYTSLSSFLTDYRYQIKDIKSQQIKMQDRKITILNGNSALITANGECTSIKKSGQSNKSAFVWTLVFQSVNNNWKIIHINM